MFHFDPTINLGTLIAIISILFVGFKGIRHMNRMEFKVDLMWAYWKKKFNDIEDKESEDGIEE